jgi:hypothetical protein
MARASPHFSAYCNSSHCLAPLQYSFARPIEYGLRGPLGGPQDALDHRTAIFRQINKERAAAHHDALKLPEQCVLLTRRLRPIRHKYAVLGLLLPDNFQSVLPITTQSDRAVPSPSRSSCIELDQCREFILAFVTHPKLSDFNAGEAL